MADLFIGNEALKDFAGGWKRGQRAELRSEELITHAFVCGAAGSGKTVLAKGLVEEALRAGIPVIAIDLKGDITSMALTRRFVEPRHLTPIFGTDSAQVRSDYLGGLTTSLAVADLVEEYDARVDPRIFSPGSKLARPLALSGLPSFTEKPRTELEREERGILIEALARGLVERMHGGGRPTGKRKSKQKLIEELLLWAARNGETLTGVTGIHRLQELVAAPPIARIGGMPIEDHSPERKRTELREELANLVAGAGKRWFAGEPLSIETLLGGAPEGRTPLAILYMGHVADSADHGFVVAQVCSAIYEWMRRVPPTGSLRLLLYIDELGGGGGARALLPSHPYNPPSKAALSLLVKQGRSAGVGCILATQNPIDVDRHCLANVATWAVGRLREEADGKRLRSVMSELGIDARRAVEMVQRLERHHFMLTAPGRQPGWIVERWLYSIHQQLSASQVEMLAGLLAQAQPVQTAPPVPLPRDPLPTDSASAQRGPATTPSPEPPALGPEPLFQEDHTDDDTSGDTLPTLAVDISDPRSWRIESHDTGPLDLAVGTTTTVGRSRSADITVRSDSYLSSQHFEIRVHQDSVAVRPLSAKNPLRLNGEAVRDTIELKASQAPFELRAGTSVFRLCPVTSKA